MQINPVNQHILLHQPCYMRKVLFRTIHFSILRKLVVGDYQNCLVYLATYHGILMMLLLHHQSDTDFAVAQVNKLSIEFFESILDCNDIASSLVLALML